MSHIITNLLSEKRGAAYTNSEFQFFAFYDNTLYIRDSYTIKSYSLTDKEPKLIVDLSRYMDDVKSYKNFYDPIVTQNNDGLEVSYHVKKENNEYLRITIDLINKEIIEEEILHQESKPKYLNTILIESVNNENIASDYGLNYGFSFFFDLNDLAKLRWPY